MGVSVVMRCAALMAGVALLSACGPSGQTGAASGGAKFAGLDREVLDWRQEIIATNPLCKSTVADQKCESFEVACKAERTVTPADQAKGVTARVVVMITWNGFDSKFKHAQSGTQAAEFTKTASGWTRADHKPVYMQTCGDM